ncbi:MAG: hypothetical protein ACQEXJ_22735 [Myxococcota bacterium]
MGSAAARLVLLSALTMGSVGGAEAATLRVETESGPGGPGVPGAAVILDGAETGAATGQDGVAVLEEVAEGPHEVAATAPGYFPVGPVAVSVNATAGETAVGLTLHPAAIPATEASDWADDACGRVTWDEARLADNVTGLAVEVVVAGGAPIGGAGDVDRGGEASLCLDATPDDGDTAWATVAAHYEDGTVGPPASSPGFVFDRSPPAPGEPTAVALAAEDCDPAPGAVAPVRLTFTPEDPHTGVAAVSWRRAGEDWVPVEGLPAEGEEIMVTTTLASPARGTDLEVRATNGVGLRATASTTIVGPDCVPDWIPVDPGPGEDAAGDVAEPVSDVPTVDADSDGSPEPAPDQPTATPDPGGGCAGGGGAPMWLGGLALLGLVGRRRCRTAVPGGR